MSFYFSIDDKMIKDNLNSLYNHYLKINKGVIWSNTDIIKI
jgi:hypothetical protein